MTRDEIVDAIFNNILNNRFSEILSVSDDDIKVSIESYVYNDFNMKYKVSPKYTEKYNGLLISVASHQCNHQIHPLTCGVDSNHELLCPRITYNGSYMLVCPTCGYIQEGF